MGRTGHHYAKRNKHVHKDKSCMFSLKFWSMCWGREGYHETRSDITKREEDILKEREIGKRNQCDKKKGNRKHHDASR